MLYAPNAQGDLGEHSYAPRPPLPALESVWHDAAQQAQAFWEQVLADPRISPRFRPLAEKSLKTLQDRSY
jgi:hypothetical protein